MITPPNDLAPIAHVAKNLCFGCGPANPIGLRLDFYPAEDGSVFCPLTVSSAYEGPVGYVHGGIIATMLDEAMNKAVRATGVVGMTRTLTIDYLRPVRSGSPIRVEGKLTSQEGRKFWIEARILDERNHVLATAKGLFIEIKPRA